MKESPVIRFTVYFTSGIILQHLFMPSVLLILILLLLGMAGLTISKFRDVSRLTKLPAIIFGCMTIIACGALVYQMQDPRVKEYPFPEKEVQGVQFFGRIESIDLLHNQRLHLTISSDSIMYKTYSKRKTYQIDCYIKETEISKLQKLYGKINPGNTIVIIGDYSRGTESRNPGEFDFAKYLEDKGIAGVVQVKGTHNVHLLNDKKEVAASIILSIRKAIDERIDLLFDDETAGLVKGLLLGDKNEISEDMQTWFVNAGVAHVLAVSGLNVAFVSLMIMLLLGRFSLKTRYIGSGIGILFFWMIAGSSPPVLRAVIMGYVVILNALMNRNSSALNTLFISAAIILLIAPQDVFSPSFQLTFVGVLSLVLVYPPLKEMVDQLHIKNAILRKALLFFALTFAAQLGTMPLTDYYFGKLSVTALFSNFFVVPAISGIMGGSMMALLVSVVAPQTAMLLGYGNNALVHFIYWVVKLCGADSYAFVSLPRFGMFGVFGYYGLLTIFLFYLPKFSSHKSKLVLIVLVCLSLLFFQNICRTRLLPENMLSVISADVGQGDASFILFPNGKSMLVDAGNADARYDNGKKVLLPLIDYLEIPVIDYGVISHFDSDHYKGFASLIRAGKIKNICVSSCSGRKEDVERFVEFAKLSGTRVLYPEDTTWILDGCMLHFLSGKALPMRDFLSLNDKSLMLKCTYGKKSFLFTGDAQKVRESFLLARYKDHLHSDVLKVAHHGSKYGTSEEFLAAVAPGVGLISAGVRNRFHHPSAEVLERLQADSISIFRTDKEGAIILCSDGKSIKHLNWHE